jgi:hypothetical protein
MALCTLVIKLQDIQSLERNGQDPDYEALGVSVLGGQNKNGELYHRRYMK